MFQLPGLLIFVELQHTTAQKVIKTQTIVQTVRLCLKTLVSLCIKLKEYQRNVYNHSHLATTEAANP